MSEISKFSRPIFKKLADWFTFWSFLKHVAMFPTHSYNVFMMIATLGFYDLDLMILVQLFFRSRDLVQYHLGEFIARGKYLKCLI